LCHRDGFQGAEQKCADERDPASSFTGRHSEGGREGKGGGGNECSKRLEIPSSNGSKRVAYRQNIGSRLRRSGPGHQGAYKKRTGKGGGLPQHQLTEGLRSGGPGKLRGLARGRPKKGGKKNCKPRKRGCSEYCRGMGAIVKAALESDSLQVGRSRGELEKNAESDTSDRNIERPFGGKKVNPVTSEQDRLGTRGA